MYRRILQKGSVYMIGYDKTLILIRTPGHAPVTGQGPNEVNMIVTSGVCNTATSQPPIVTGCKQLSI
jgi:hypothetical protein